MLASPVVRPIRALALAAALPMALGLPDAGAQQPSGEPALIANSISPFTAPGRPLEIALTVVNPGSAPLDGAVVRVTVHNRIVTRSELRQALDGDPRGDIILVTTEELGDPIGPAGRRDVVIRRELGEIANTFGRSGVDGVYPVSIQLRAGGTTLARASTAVPFFAEPPQTRLNVVWVYPVHWPAAFDSRGAYPAGSIERALQTGGRLDATLSALESHSFLPLTLAPTGLLVDQLKDLADGYVMSTSRGQRAIHAGDQEALAASSALQRLKQVVSSRTFQLVSSTYARADIVGLAHDRMREELARQIEAETERAANDLGITPAPEFLVAPDGRLDARSAVDVVALGARTVVVSPEDLPERFTKFGYDRPVTITGGGRVRLTALIADAAIRDRLAREAEAALTVQGALAETAASYFELPALAAERLLVIATPGMPDPRVASGLLDGIAAAPWVRLRPAPEAVEALPPTEEPIVMPIARPGDRTPLAAARAARRAVQILGQVLGEQERPVETLERFILASESIDWTRDPQRGSVFARAARGSAERTLGLIGIPSRQVTFTSRIAQIPVTILNETGQPVSIRIRLLSSKIRFPEGATRTLDVPQRVLTVTFRAEMRATGSFPLTIRIETPDGRASFGEGQINVRSTAVSAVTLVGTGGGALVLLLGWARRLVRARRRANEPPA